MSSVMSMPTKSRMGSDHFAANHVEGLLRGVKAYAVAVAWKLSFDDFRLLAVSHSNVNEPHWFFRSAAGGAGNAGDTDSKSCIAALANPFRECNRYLLAHCPVFCDQHRRYVGERCL